MNFIDSFSVRTSNVLRRMGLTTKEAVLKAIKDRTLHPSNTQALGFGAKSLREVREKLGLKQDLTNQQVCEYRSEFARTMRNHGVAFRDIARTLRLRGPDEARSLVAKAERKFPSGQLTTDSKIV